MHLAVFRRLFELRMLFEITPLRQGVEVGPNTSFSGNHTLAIAALIVDRGQDKASGQSPQIEFIESSGRLVKIVDVVNNLAIDGAQRSEVFRVQVTNNRSTCVQVREPSERPLQGIISEQMEGRTEEAERRRRHFGELGGEPACGEGPIIQE